MWSEQGLLLVPSTLQVLAQQSTDGRDLEHCGPAVVAYGLVSWGAEATIFDAFVVAFGLNGGLAVVVVDSRYLHDNQLTGTIPSTVGQLSSLKEL